jgi:hypothetical protein
VQVEDGDVLAESLAVLAHEPLAQAAEAFGLAGSNVDDHAAVALAWSCARGTGAPK